MQRAARGLVNGPGPTTPLIQIAFVLMFVAKRREPPAGVQRSDQELRRPAYITVDYVEVLHHQQRGHPDTVGHFQRNDTVGDSLRGFRFLILLRDDGGRSQRYSHALCVLEIGLRGEHEHRIPR